MKFFEKKLKNYKRMVVTCFLKHDIWSLESHREKWKPNVYRPIHAECTQPVFQNIIIHLLGENTTLENMLLEISIKFTNFHGYACIQFKEHGIN